MSHIPLTSFTFYYKINSIKKWSSYSAYFSNSLFFTFLKFVPTTSSISLGVWLYIMGFRKAQYKPTWKPNLVVKPLYVCPKPIMIFRILNTPSSAVSSDIWNFIFFTTFELLFFKKFYILKASILCKFAFKVKVCNLLYYYFFLLFFSILFILLTFVY